MGISVVVCGGRMGSIQRMQTKARVYEGSMGIYDGSVRVYEGNAEVWGVFEGSVGSIQRML